MSERRGGRGRLRHKVLPAMERDRLMDTLQVILPTPSNSTPDIRWVHTRHSSAFQTCAVPANRVGEPSLNGVFVCESDFGLLNFPKKLAAFYLFAFD